MMRLRFAGHRGACSGSPALILRFCSLKFVLMNYPADKIHGF